MLAMIPDAELRLTGLETIPSTVGPLENPKTILSRTNATAVRSVLDALSQGRSVHLVGGGREIVSFARAAERLMNGQRVEHPELACFESWTEVQDYVDLDEQGGDLRLMVNLVDEFGVQSIIDALDGTTPEARADLIVSTAHKAKGREWDTVQLAGDFLIGGKNGEPKRMPSDDAEKRLLYVAVTRARLKLDVEAIEVREGFAPAADAGVLMDPAKTLERYASTTPAIPTELVVTEAETKRKPYKRASYREGVQWIADNDEPTSGDVEQISGQISTLLLADLFEKDPIDVARAILRVRLKEEA
jgi:hypothetical protein